MSVRCGGKQWLEDLSPGAPSNLQWMAPHTTHLYLLETRKQGVITHSLHLHAQNIPTMRQDFLRSVQFYPEETLKWLYMLSSLFIWTTVTLSINFKIDFNILLMTFKVLSGLAPGYISGFLKLLLKSLLIHIVILLVLFFLYWLF